MLDSPDSTVSLSLPKPVASVTARTSMRCGRSGKVGRRRRCAFTSSRTTRATLPWRLVSGNLGYLVKASAWNAPCTSTLNDGQAGFAASETDEADGWCCLPLLKAV